MVYSTYKNGEFGGWFIVLPTWRWRQALLDMDAPRRALTELHPAKELLQRGREGWPLEVLKRNLAKNRGIQWIPSGNLT